ncbi:MAG: hypothetical protein GXX79_10960 [Actinomycetales bacterium]|nr:hypothetical protein [Actinomycetales bacterium]
MGLWVVSAVIFGVMLSAGEREAFDHAAVLLLVAVFNLLVLILLIKVSLFLRRERRKEGVGEGA